VRKGAGGGLYAHRARAGGGDKRRGRGRSCAREAPAFKRSAWGTRAADAAAVEVEVEVEMEARAQGDFGIASSWGASSLCCAGVAAVTGGGETVAGLEGLERQGGGGGRGNGEETEFQRV